jgi:hypothetical protein
VPCAAAVQAFQLLGAWCHVLDAAQDHQGPAEGGLNASCQLIEPMPTCQHISTNLVCIWLTQIVPPVCSGMLEFGLLLPNRAVAAWPGSHTSA